MRPIKRRDVIRALMTLTGGLAALYPLRTRAVGPPAARWRALDDTGPGPRAAPALAADPQGRLVLFGGTDAASEELPGGTWVFEGANWWPVSATEPPPRAWAAAAFDAARGQTVLFGGVDAREVPLAETWLWNGREWSQASPFNSPPARSRAAMAYDPVQRLVVLFGGFGAGGFLGDTWAWDGSRWLPLEVRGPSPRLLAAMAADCDGKLVLHGGFDGGRLLGDTWVLRGGTWLQGPSLGVGRAGAALAADPLRGGLVLFGGQITTTGLVDGRSWRWDGVGWRPQPVAGPAPRMAAGMASLGQGIVLFGGHAAGRSLADTWWLG